MTARLTLDAAFTQTWSGLLSAVRSRARARPNAGSLIPKHRVDHSFMGAGGGVGACPAPVDRVRQRTDGDAFSLARSGCRMFHVKRRPAGPQERIDFTLY